MKKLLILSLLIFAACKEGDIPFSTNEWEDEARTSYDTLGIPDEDIRFKHTYTTPGGIKVRSVVPIPPDYLELADQGARRQRESFEQMFPQWDQVTFSERRIDVIEPSTNRGTGEKCVTESDDPGAPCLYVRGIKAAATVLGVDDLWQKLDLNPPVVIPHQQYQNWTKPDWWANSVHYEFEHVVGWKNRTVAPTNVFYHYIGEYDAHPWTWPPVMGLAGKKRSCFVN